MRRLWPFTARGTGALVLGIGCFILANEIGVVELMYFGMLLLGVLAAGWVSLRLVRRTEPRDPLALPGHRHGRRGSATVVARVGVRSPFPTSPGTWEDDAAQGRDRGSARAPFPRSARDSAAARSSSSSNTRSRGARRGIHSLGPLTVTSTDPFGLTRRRTVFNEHTKATIAPAVIELSPLTTCSATPAGRCIPRRTTSARAPTTSSRDRTCPATRCAASTGAPPRTAATSWCGRRSRSPPRTPSSSSIAGCCGTRPRRLSTTGADAGFETAVSVAISVITRLVHDGYAVDVVDSDGTPLAERLEGGDMTAVEDVRTHFATLTARRDDHLIGLSKLFHGDRHRSRHPHPRAPGRSGCRCPRADRAPQLPSDPVRGGARAGCPRPGVRCRVARGIHPSRLGSREHVDGRRRARSEPCVPLSACAPTRAPASRHPCPRARRRTGSAPAPRSGDDHRRPRRDHRRCHARAPA